MSLTDSSQAGSQQPKNLQQVQHLLLPKLVACVAREVGVGTRPVAFGHVLQATLVLQDELDLHTARGSTDAGILTAHERSALAALFHARFDEEAYLAMFAKALRAGLRQRAA